MTFGEQIKLEMYELQKLGVKIPSKAFALASDEASLKKYQNMKVSECVDMLILLGQI